MDSSFRKVVQKKIYDVLSHKYGLILVIFGVFALGISAFHFGEAVVDWSREKYAAVFNSFSDNVAGRSFRQRLCLPVPIDVVYTWVNGTDESLVVELRRVKRDMERELNITREEKCSFSNCIPAAMAILNPMIPMALTLTQLVELYPAFSDATSLFDLQSEGEDKLNITVVTFGNETHVNPVVDLSLVIYGMNITVSKGFYTSDPSVPRGIQLKDTILMSGFPHQYTQEELTAKLPNPVHKIDLYSDKGIAVLHVPKKEDFDSLVNIKNFTLEGKEPILHAAKLVWDLRDFSRDEDIAASRFEDNEELRYSLRSVEKFAPWVRHIYIVTNGQLPYWLDLESSRVTIVTHEEIFPNKSHLPTYSSPAIESHLHRIPGLSDKFIYLNDDVMFGSEVWPDDFFSYATGQKVYLTWPVPNCNEGCPSTWIKDGYCDKACNNSECDWDAGDCDGDAGRIQLGAGYQGGYGDPSLQAIAYCNTGCANNWIADKYCDTACNIKKCGFDAGDCGTKNYEELYEIPLSFSEINYRLPPGEFVGFFNLTDIVMSDGMITEAFYNDSSIIRQVAVGNKYKVMTIVLQHDHNETTLHFQLKGHQGANRGFRFNFTLTVNTNKTLMGVYEKQAKKKAMNLTDAVDGDWDEEDDLVVIQEVPEEEQQPRPVQGLRGVGAGLPVIPPGVDRNLTSVIVPAVIRHELGALNKALLEGDLTQKGFEIKWKVLYAKYMKIKDDPNYPLETKQSLNGTKNISNNSQELNNTGQGSNVKGQGSDGEAHQNLRKLLAIPSDWRQEIMSIKPQEKKGSELITYSQDEAAMSDRIYGRNKNEVVEDFLDKVKVGEETGVLPWERKNLLSELQKMRENVLRASEFESPHHNGRRLLDTFGDSLRHVNKLFNKAFGFVARKVPAHMPHMIDRHIMADLQAQFPNEWDVTSSHKVRHSKDMQYAFSYFYYLMGVSEQVTPESVFDEMDTDHSRVLSDRELRTFAARMYDLPLYLETLQGLEQIFVNCSNHLQEEQKSAYAPPTQEVYYDKTMPQVTRHLFLSCGGVLKLVKDKFKPKPKFKYTTVDDSDVTFYMIRTNVSSVVGQLDNVRKHSKKFICLNDNIEHGSEEARTVKAVLQDFYESLFPIPSQFELPREYRNRFLHTDELREWRQYRDWLKFWTHLALIVLVIFTIVSFFGDKIEAAHRRLVRVASHKDQDGSGPANEEGESSSTNGSGSSNSQSKQSPLLPV
ncbi:N-acetylglucosamine-1-phosphotransferase subunits alpha/beta-like [Haliotis rufescens]|uniref:N-acetylglucosamine-1-phosphotransferase subunits alpha/beta-like n=1 Tax=Haliotis rufescens TaxID=6454 RepID=UPI00201F85F4|nr:N-acetylglucosamine-1-phosphotransferase subunits alpha/beta-like [Haliotis rufescens]